MYHITSVAKAVVISVPYAFEVDPREFELGQQSKKVRQFVLILSIVNKTQ